MPHRSLRARIAPVLLALFASTSAHAVILYGGSDGRVTTAPTGVLAQAGWQYEGAWKDGVGTAVAPNYFITARHLGGQAGDSFTLGGVSYTTTEAFDDPAGTDLRIWKIDGAFPTYAPIYTKTDETVDSPLMTVFGRGTLRGGDVVGPNGDQGYFWGPSDGLMSWGLNRVAFLVDDGDSPNHEFLGFDFTPLGLPGVPNPATLSAGDSGGGVFIQDVDGLWKLAGVNYAVDGPFSLEQTTGYFPAAMYDARDFYVYTGGPETGFLVPHPTPDGPIWQSAYASRVSTRADFIASVIGVPEPASAALLALGAATFVVAAGRRKLGR